jgi:iron-sulfur cluster repair protein YtfE (RIC family)/pyruvate-formate lyase-activating enzyme
VTLSSLVQQILQTHHALLRHELPLLQHSLAHAAPVIARPWAELHTLLLAHLDREETLLFPAIIALDSGADPHRCELLGPIRQMEAEHGRIRELEASLRHNAALAGSAEARLRMVLDDLDRHAALEDDRLFPQALARWAAAIEPELSRVAQARSEELAELCATALEDHARLRLALSALLTTEGDELEGLAREIEAHLSAEEAVVYPALAAVFAGRIPHESGWLSMLHELPLERKATRQWTDSLRRSLPQRSAALDAFLGAIEAHAAFEETRLFPRAIQQLAGLDAVVEEAPPVSKQTILRQPQGRCSTCLQEVPARVLRTETEVRLEKLCPEHGVTVELLSRSPDYWADLDTFYFQVNAEEHPQRDFMVRLTESCNLDCPICLAKANTEDTPDLDLSGLSTLLSERRGIKVDLLAAEPTLRADLTDWIRQVKASGNIAALHTNGIKLADRAYAENLKQAGVDEVFLQFDGFDDDAHMKLRGARLLKRRLKALDNLRELNIATSLIVVVARGVNEAEIGKVYQFALRPENNHVREVFFLGLRVLGSTRYAQEGGMADRALMPDALIELLCAQEPEIKREDIRRFNKLYFSMLSAFRVRKCLYVQHYLVARDAQGGATTAAQLLPMDKVEAACDAYAKRLPRHPTIARARFMADIARLGVRRETVGMLFDMVQLQALFKTGMNLEQVPRRFLLLGFITACDPQNFDSEVAINCGKGELSVHA